MTFSTNDGYKGPLSGLSCSLPSSSSFDFKRVLSSKVDIATNLIWDRDVRWIRNGTTVVLCYVGEYIDFDMLDIVDKLGQPIIVVSPMNVRDHTSIYENVIFHQVDFLHYDSMYYEGEKFHKKKHKYSCMSRRTTDWKYLFLVHTVKLFGDSLLYTNIHDHVDRHNYDSYLAEIGDLLSVPVDDIEFSGTKGGCTTSDLTFEEQWNIHDIIRYSYVNFTVESEFDTTKNDIIMPHTYLTEKTLKPLAAGVFPVHVGQMGGYKTLESFGFTGFNEVIDISYDGIAEDYDRFVALIKAIQNIDFSVIEDVCYRNYRWFHDDFYDYMVEKNKPKIKHLEEIIRNVT